MMLIPPSTAALLLTAMLSLSGLSYGQTTRRTVLPAPQEISFGDGSIDATHLCLRTSLTDTDDAFAMRTLFDGLSVKQRICSGGGMPVLVKHPGDEGPLPVPGETAGPNSREAYSLSITNTGVSISGNSSAAIFYGVQTLLQMADHGDNSVRLPLASAKDWPALAYRGTLMDAGSEGPMLHLNEIEKQLDLIARFKGNQYFFYSEGSIALKGYPLLNPNARFTQQEIRDVIAYARQRHIDVVPAVEMYAHLHDLFRIERYSGLADFPHGTQFDPRNPAVKAVLQDWATQLSALFPSPFVDIGFDETWSLQKVSAEGGANTTPVQLFISQLDTVTSLFQTRGKTVMAYADIMVKFPGIIPQLPKGLIALPWWYEPFDDAQYDHWLKPLANQGVPHIATSGITSWDQIAPDFATSFANIDTFLIAGKRSHSVGLLNTLWTDDGQALMEMSWPGVAYGTAAAWQSQPMQPASFFDEYSSLQYSPSVSIAMAHAMAQLALAETALQHALGPETMVELWRDPFRADSLQQTEQHADDLHQARLHAEDALTNLYEMQQSEPHSEGLTSFIAGAQMIDLAGLKFLYANEIDATWKSLPEKPTKEELLNVLSQGISNEAHSRCMDLMDGFSETRKTYEAAWHQQYNDYRLGTALGRWDAEYRYWLRAQANFEILRKTFNTGDKLPTLRKITTESF